MIKYKDIVEIFDHDDVDYVVSTLLDASYEFLLGPDGLEVISKYGTASEVRKLVNIMISDYEVTRWSYSKELTSYLYEIAYEGNCFELYDDLKRSLSKVRKSQDIIKVMDKFINELSSSLEYELFEGDINTKNFILFLVDYYK